MYQGKYRIAECNIEISSQYPYIHEYCSEYVTDFSESDCIKIKITKEDIDYERRRSESEDIKEGIPVRSFQEDYLETLAVYRKLADELVERGIILFHGSVIAVDGEAYLFTAKSGTGKSTHTRLWRECFGERAVMINDDKPLLRITETGVTAYGTPWNGKHHLGENISAPLKAICILTRAEENHIEKVSKKAVYPMLLQQTHRNNDAEKMTKTLRLIDIMAAQIQLYELGCNMEEEAARVAYNGMNAGLKKSSFENEIDKHGKLIYTNVGDSMMPLLRQNRDLIIIEKPAGRLKKYDVPLYKRDSGQYVLHRILRVRKNDYVICGDNRWSKEYGITDGHIIGVLTGIIRDGKTIPVTDKKYKFYVHLWCDFFWIRAAWLYGKYHLKNVFKKK